MIDPITLLFGAAFASVFIALFAFDIGLKVGLRLPREPKQPATQYKRGD